MIKKKDIEKLNNFHNFYIKIKNLHTHNESLHIPLRELYIFHFFGCIKLYTTIP